MSLSPARPMGPYFSVDLQKPTERSVVGPYIIYDILYRLQTPKYLWRIYWRGLPCIHEGGATAYSVLSGQHNGAALVL